MTAEKGLEVHIAKFSVNVYRKKKIFFLWF